MINRHTLAKSNTFFDVVPIAFYEVVLTFTSIKPECIWFYMGAFDPLRLEFCIE